MVDELNSDSMKSALTGKMPLLVDFWAPWCGPCRQLAPTFEQLSKELDGKLRFAKVNVDDNQDLGGTYGITAIPCMILFKDGKEVNRLVGGMSAEILKKKVTEMLV